jgi:hypothetical protein
MRTIAALVVCLALPAYAKNVTCQDGTTSKSGGGACSHHGGIATNDSVSCKDGTSSKPGKGACSHHGGAHGEGGYGGHGEGGYGGHGKGGYGAGPK